jgi:hypothetical protein
MSETVTGTSVPSESSPAGLGDGTLGMQAFAIPGESRSAYWQRELSGVPVLSLSTSKARSAVRSGQFAARLRRIGKIHTEQLRRVSQRESAPLSVVLLSAFQALVVRYTSQEDFVIGCALANLCISVARRSFW